MFQFKCRPFNRYSFISGHTITQIGLTWRFVYRGCEIPHGVFLSLTSLQFDVLDGSSFPQKQESEDYEGNYWETHHDYDVKDRVG